MNFVGKRNCGRRTGQEFYPQDGYSVWCRIEDLSNVCGYDPYTQFGILRELADAYPGRPGQDPDEFAEEHPMQALACLVRRYLAEYREAAEVPADMSRVSHEASQRPGKAA